MVWFGSYPPALRAAVQSARLGERERGYAFVVLGVASHRKFRYVCQNTEIYVTFGFKDMVSFTIHVRHPSLGCSFSAVEYLSLIHI